MCEERRYEYIVLRSPPALRLSAAIRAGGHGTTLKENTIRHARSLTNTSHLMKPRRSEPGRVLSDAVFTNSTMH